MCRLSHSIIWHTAKSKTTTAGVVIIEEDEMTKQEYQYFQEQKEANRDLFNDYSL